MLVAAAVNSPFDPSVVVLTRVLEVIAVLVEHVPPPAIVVLIDTSETVLLSAILLADAGAAAKIDRPVTKSKVAVEIEINFLNMITSMFPSTSLFSRGFEEIQEWAK